MPVSVGLSSSTLFLCVSLGGAEAMPELRELVKLGLRHYCPLTPSLVSISLCPSLPLPVSLPLSGPLPLFASLCLSASLWELSTVAEGRSGHFVKVFSKPARHYSYTLTHFRRRVAVMTDRDSEACCGGDAVVLSQGGILNIRQKSLGN